MKKIIALALAVVMVMSMVCFAGAEEFTDAAQIDKMNTEAVTVLSEMGIIAGMGDGTFGPAATLTRAQAAKIICYMLLGKDKAEALAPADGKFSDVPASHWSNKYVAYCADQGIVAGIGSGKFGPNNKLTGYAFGKMLLCGAAGFDAASNGLTGNDWDSNTRKLLAENNLLGNANVTAKDLDRQSACHLALNFLFYKEADDPSETLAYKTFGITRMGGDLDKDDLYRPTTIYSTDTAGVCWEGNDLIVKASPIYMVSGPVPCKTIVKNLNGAEPTSENMICYRNGIMSKNTTLDSTPLTADNEKVFVCSGNGVTSEFYYDATVNHYTCIMHYSYASKVTAVTEPDVSAAGKVLTDGSVTLDVNGVPMVCVSNDFTEADIGTYALFDYNCTTTWTAVKSLVSVRKAKTVSGILSSEDDTVKVGGKTYNTLLVDAGVKANTPMPYTAAGYLANGGAVGDTVTLILDPVTNMCYGIAKE